MFFLFFLFFLWIQFFLIFFANPLLGYLSFLFFFFSYPRVSLNLSTSWHLTPIFAPISFLLFIVPSLSSCRFSCFRSFPVSCLFFCAHTLFYYYIHPIFFPLLPTRPLLLSFPPSLLNFCSHFPFALWFHSPLPCLTSRVFYVSSA